MESALIYATSAVVVLGLLIFVHELGHFLVAKASGVAVLRFSLGFGPRLFGKRIGETDYVVSAFPLGGYVKMLGAETEPGDDDDEDFDPEAAGIDPARAFNNRPLHKRIAIVLAGPAANLIFAWITVLVAVIGWGIGDLSKEALVGKLIDGMPAERAGLVVGDRIVAVGGQEIADWESLTKTIRAGGGAETTLRVEREGETRELQLTPERQELRNLFDEVTGEAFLIGIQPARVKVEVALADAPRVAFNQTLFYSNIIVQGLWKMLTGKVSAKEIGGPIQIVRTAGERAQSGMEDLLHFMALLGVNLGILNLLPIPVLDGGQLVFLLIEGVLRRPLEGRPREMAQQVGLVLLVGLMLFAFYNDISRWVQGS